MSDSSSTETELLEGLQLRFALTNSGQQMRSHLDTLLIPLLEALDKADASVKPRIIALLGQINKKLRSLPDATLPIKELCEDTFGEKSQPALYSQSFRLMYITTAAERAASSELVWSIPKLLYGLATRPTSQKGMITTALLTAVLRCNGIQEDGFRLFDFINSPDQAKQLLACATDLFLYNPAAPTSAPQAASTPAVVAAGLSPASQSHITSEGKARWASDSEALKVLKLNMLSIVGSDLTFPRHCPSAIHEMRALAFQCASCDSYFPQVASRGEDALKRLPPLDYESQTFIGSVLGAFLGSDPQTPAESKRTPAPIAARLRLISYLNRSAKAASTFPQWIRVIFECLFGSSTSSKLRRQGVVFMQWAIKMAPQNQIDQAAPILLQGIKKILAESTAGSSNGRIDEDILRGAAFVAWGTLGKRSPRLFSSDLEHLRSMFDAFDSESSNVRLSIQEALLAMIPAYSSAATNSQMQEGMLELLKGQLASAVRQARYCALRYVISAFEFSRMDARWVCLLGLADTEREVRVLAQSGLAIPPEMLVERKDKLPAFADAIGFLHQRVQEASSQPRGGGASLSASNPSVYGGIIDFCRLLLLSGGIAAQTENSLGVVVATLDIESISDGKELSTELQRSSMRLGLSGLEATDDSSGSTLRKWSDIVSFALTNPRLSESNALSKSLVCLVELMSLGSQESSLGFFNQRQVFRSLVSLRNPVAQLRAVQALAILYAVKLHKDGGQGLALQPGFWDTEVAGLLGDLLAAINEADHPNLLDKKQGSILALGFITSGLQTARLALKRSWADLGIRPVGDIIATAQAALLEATKRAGSMPSTHPMIVAALCAAIGEIGKAGPIVIENGYFGQEAMDAVVDIAKRTNEAKVQDAAFRAVADIALGDTELAGKLIGFLRQSASAVNKKQLDAHFRIGEALAIALGRFGCSLVNIGWVFPIDPSLVYGEDGLGANSAAIDSLLDLIVGDLTRSANPQNRQAAAVWALSLVQFCPNLEQLNPWLTKLHSSLCVLLTDRDEFTQEVASKTLGLVYDMGDAALKEDLVYSLMSMFGSNSGDKRHGAGGAQQSLQQQIQSGQPLLEQADLGQTPDGHAISSTYKSILSLASDMQNPSLVYQFMQLASHTAVWNSRRGAAYGFASVIEKARESIRPHMKSIVPKLYRYTYDPSPQTRAAMTSIWRALLGSGVPADTSTRAESSTGNGSSGSESTGAQSAAWAKSGASVIETFWEPIIEECLASMGQREWRVRESGCSALAGTVPGADPELVVPYMERIWQMTFRALDDIKGSVRESGLKTCQALANATIAWCTPRVPSEPERDRRAQAVLAILIPFLVDKGILSDAEDVRGFSMGLLLKLCKAGGSYLTGFVPSIVERLLESLSNMEPQAANYLTFHADSHNISQEQLESARLSAVKASPIMQGIELALEQLDANSMAELVPGLRTIIRRGVGLPTRAGCARAVVTLCVKSPTLIRPHASVLVKAISGVLVENSALQRQAWAAAIGYMAPMLSAGMFKNLLKHLEKVYFDKYETAVRGVSGLVLEQLSLRCPERLRENTSGPGTISFVLFGSWDAQESIRETFRSTWQEHTLGSGGKLVEEHLEELLERPISSVSSDSWDCRVQGANAIADIAGMLERAARVASTDKQAAQAALQKLLDLTIPPLAAAFKVRVWPGREHVLACLVKVCVVGSTLISHDSDDKSGEVARSVFDILVKEMARGDLGYRRAAVTHYCSFIEAVPLDAYSEVSEKLLEIIQTCMVVDKSAKQQGVSGGAGNRMDVDEDEDPMHKPQRLMLISAAIKALSLSLPRGRMLENAEAASSAALLKEIAETGVWNIRVASLEGLSSLVGHYSTLKQQQQQQAVTTGRVVGILEAAGLKSVLQAVRMCAAEGKYVAVRTAAFDALEAVFKAIHFIPANERSQMVAECHEEAQYILNLLQQDAVPSISDRAKDARAKWSSGK